MDTEKQSQNEIQISEQTDEITESIRQFSDLIPSLCALAFTFFEESIDNRKAWKFERMSLFIMLASQVVT